MRLSEAVDALLAATAADGRSPRTIKYYGDSLRHLVEFLGDVEVEQVSIHDLRRYATALRTKGKRYASHPTTHEKEGGLSPFSVANYLRAVQRLFHWLTEEGLLEVDPAARLKNPTPRRREPKAVSLEDMQRLIRAAAGSEPSNIRDRALLLLLADTGARAGGITHIHLQDLKINGEAAVKLHEKGERDRVVPLSTSTAEALQGWLAVRPDLGPGCDWLFVNLGRNVKECRLTEDALGEILRRLKKRGGVTGPVNPHSFRHAFAREWLRSGGDLATLARVLGHADPALTLRSYSIFSDTELRPFHAKHSPVSRLDDDL